MLLVGGGVNPGERYVRIEWCCCGRFFVGARAVCLKKVPCASRISNDSGSVCSCV
jgi:hypothetical protein